MRAFAVLACAALALAACGDAADRDARDGDGVPTITVTTPPWSGQGLTLETLPGAWAAKASDCANPDFTITRTGSALRVDTNLNGWVRAGNVRLGAKPAMVFTNPRRIIRLESRADGLYLLPPSDGMVVVGDENVFEDGVAFGKCTV